MADGLIGYTGFVGGTLLRQRRFDDLYRSTNIGEIAGKEYGLLICAGAPAAKWKANKEPEEDRRNLARLMEALEKTRARTAVLISTIDVYPNPALVYEDTPFDAEAGGAYGRNRYELERFFARQFPEGFIVRLPGLFGEGLRKNFLFDLIRNPDSLKLTDRRSLFQFYNMARLWRDLETITGSGVRLFNVATPPVESGEVARRCFGVDFDNETGNGPVSYDMRTRRAAVFGRADEYIVSREEVMEEISAFAAREKAAQA